MNATAKMIYPDKTTANAILGKMAKRHPNDKFIVVQLPIGFQVSRVFDPKLTAFQNNISLVAEPALTNVNVTEGTVLTQEALKKDAKAAKYTAAYGKVKDMNKPKQATAPKAEQDVYVALHFVKQTALWLEVKDQGVTKWVQKSSLTGWDVDHNMMIVYLKMPKAYAKKRELAYHFNPQDAAKAILSPAGVA